MKHSNKLILGSQSPRRKQLLKQVGFTFDVISADFEEIFPEEMPVKDVAEFLATEKNRVCREICQDETILTSDTVVIVDNKILGKPMDKKHATEMLQSLSRKSHLVVSGVTISNNSKRISFSNTTEVKVKDLSVQEITHYVDKFQPMDKAGAYGIQEWFGLAAIDWIKGSYFNVVGLPIHKVYGVLTSDFGISPFGD